MHAYNSSRLAALAGLSIFLAACGSPAPSAPPPPVTTSFDGQATVVLANVPGLAGDAVVAFTGMLPTLGGALETDQPSAQLPGLLRANELHAATVGQGNTSSADASATDLFLTVGGIRLRANFVQARATARCVPRAPVTHGDVAIDGLVIDGSPVIVSGAANQTIALAGGGRVIINERSSNATGITIAALHVIVPGTGDVVIAQAHAEVDCGSTCPQAAGDFVTGAGWFSVGGANATFAVSGGIMGSGIWGDFEYDDRGEHLHVLGTGMTSYTQVDATTRRITGTADIDGAPGTYTLTLSGNGDPGRNDHFDLALSSGYSTRAPLGGGGIALHARPECP